MGITVIYVMLYGWFMSFVSMLNNAARIPYNKAACQYEDLLQSAKCKLPTDEASLLTPACAESHNFFSPTNYLPY